MTRLQLSNRYKKNNSTLIKLDFAGVVVAQED